MCGRWAVQRKYKVGLTAKEMAKVKDSEPLQKHLQKSFFTIIADSANVEIWILDRAALLEAMLDAKIPEEGQKQIFEDILQQVDADRGRYSEPDISHIKNMSLKWDRYKQKLSLPIFKEHRKVSRPK